jgi:hypothetical protein
VIEYLQELQRNSPGEIPTGLLYVTENIPDLHERNNTPDVPLTRVPYAKLTPGLAELERLQEAFR